MVGLRVFDVGALVVWLVWFFRLRDDDDDDGDDFRRGTDDAPDPGPKGDPPGLTLPMPHAPPRPARPRDPRGGADHRPEPQRRRGLPAPVPARAPVKRR